MQGKNAVQNPRKIFAHSLASFGFLKKQKRPQTRSHQGFHDFASEPFGCWKWRRWESNPRPEASPLKHLRA
ncbi:hypothetical protein KN10_1149 [Anoxybacillus flavithermus NBRC 109594]|uniref:Uncharacterized protein n=1 Tax=Anoxybacillus flavithermus NBRC 109594 TaxID=1315967 RepID=R4G055_9BACL|nr:hypothetical protein KN10_1149 [Anoxybacillus flavithermus NBRC 109594]